MSNVKETFFQDDIESAKSQTIAAKSAPSNKVASCANRDLLFEKLSVSGTTEGSSTDIVAPVPKPISVAAIASDDHETCTAAGQISSLGVQLAQLALRLAEIELRVTNLENNNGFAHQSPTVELKSSIQQLRSISSQVEIITQGLRSTPGYNIGKTFNCNSCGSMGVVAVRVKCTNCDKENWWGWWPHTK